MALNSYPARETVDISTTHVAKAGDTMAGPLNMAGNPIQNALIQSYREPVVQANTGTGFTCNLQQASFFVLTLTANASIVFQNPSPSGTVTSFTVLLRHPPTGSTYDVTWPSNVLWPDYNRVPAHSRENGTRHLYTFFTFDGGATWYGLLSARNFVG